MCKIKRKLLLGIIIAAIAALVGITAIGRRIQKHSHISPDLLSMIASGPPVLGFVDLSTPRKTQFYANRPDGSPLWMPSGNFVNLMQAAEVDSQNSLDRMVIASWPGATRLERSKTIVVAEGRFISTKVRNYAMQHGTVDRQQGHEVFYMLGHVEGTRNSLIFLDDGHIALTNSASIAPLLAVTDKNRTDPMKERASQLASAVEFLIIHFPDYPDVLEEQGTVLLQSESLARMVDWGSLSLRLDGNDMRLSFEGECKTRTDAQQLQSTIELFRQFFGPEILHSNGGRKFDPTTFAELQNQLRNAHIKVTDTRVDAFMKLSPEVWNLVTSLTAH